MIRRITSMALPGAESVMIRTGRVGKSCAGAGVPTRIDRARSHNDANVQLRCTVMISSLDARGHFFWQFTPRQRRMVQGRHRFDQIAKANAMPAPDFKWGAGVCPYSFSLYPSPDMRGMAHRRGACPGLLQGGPIRVRASPDRRTLALMTRAPAPLGAPPRHRFRFRVVRRPDPHGAISTPWRLPGGRPGT